MIIFLIFVCQTSSPNSLPSAGMLFFGFSFEIHYAIVIYNTRCSNGRQASPCGAARKLKFKLNFLYQPTAVLENRVPIHMY